MEIGEANKKDTPKLRQLFLEARKYEATLDKDVVVNR